LRTAVKRTERFTWGPPGEFETAKCWGGQGKKKTICKEGPVPQAEGKAGSLLGEKSRKRLHQFEDRKWGTGVAIKRKRAKEKGLIALSFGEKKKKSGKRKAGKEVLAGIVATSKKTFCTQKGGALR